MRVAVFGLGKLGACFTIALAKTGHEVVGVDIDEKRVQSLARCEFPYPEPRAQSDLEAVINDVDFTTDGYNSVKQSDISFVFVNTSLENGRHSIESVLSASETIGKGIADKEEYHTVAIRSTVMPGDTAGAISQTIKNSSDSKIKDDFGLCYYPEFTALGEIIKGIENPNFAIIGDIDRRAGDQVEAIANSVHQNDPNVLRMDATSAELAKMANNTFRTMKISFGNMIGEMAEELNINVRNVINMFNSDPNAETRYMKPAGKYGGPCYARDNIAFQSLAEELNITAPLASATEEMNIAHGRWLAGKVAECTAPDERVTILGMTYKPNAYISEQSQGVAFAELLSEAYQINCYDPIDIDRLDYDFDNLKTHTNAHEAVDAAETVVIATPWKEFTNPDLFDSDISLVDPWRLFNNKDLSKNVDYRPIAKNN